MADDKVKATIPTQITVTIGGTKVSVEIVAYYVLDLAASEEIQRLVMRIARLADGLDNG